MNKLHVHMLHEPQLEHVEILSSRLGDAVHLTFGKAPEDPAQVDLLIAGRPGKQVLEACSNLQALIIPFAGLPAETRALMLDYPQVEVFNLHHNAAATAEMAAALLLAAAKHLIAMDRKLRAFDWRPRYQSNPSLLLEDKTALILGFGSIGRRVGRICQGLGMQVLAIRRTIALDGDEKEIKVYGCESLEDLLPRSQVLMLCLPWTPETDGLIGTKELALLPRGAIVVNVARGPIVDEQALFEALEERRLASAGLDVWYRYPEHESDRARTPPANYPFHELDNVVMSPHRAGGSQEMEVLRMQHLADTILRAAKGEDIANKIDLERGY